MSGNRLEYVRVTVTPVRYYPQSLTPTNGDELLRLNIECRAGDKDFEVEFSAIPMRDFQSVFDLCFMSAKKEIEAHFCQPRK